MGLPPPSADSFADVLTRHAAAPPGPWAIRQGGRDYSWGKLARRSQRAAARLWHGWGVRPGDRVAWLGLNHVDQIVALFALARIGAMLVPLNYRLAAAEWRAVLADCEPVGLLHDEAWATQAGELATRATMPAWPVDALCATPQRPDAPDHARPEAPVLLVYTSGTTGAPKGAVHTQANLLANMRIAAQAQSLSPTDTVLTVLPLFHVGGLCIQTLPALQAGARIILHERFDPGATLHSIAQDRPSLTLQVPATLRALIEHPQWSQTDVSSLRAVWAGSSVLPLSLIEPIHARGVPVCNVYGATETGPFSIALGPVHAMQWPGSCGWPAPQVQARLVDERDGVGEVCLRAPNVVTRYWPDRPALDADGWFHTGDLARVEPDGRHTIVGRARDMIISGGENIYPAEIENLLCAHPLVADCAVFGQPDPTWGEIPAAAVVLRAGVPGDDGAWEATLREHLRDRLARYKQPRRWLRMSELPKTALGKVQKDRLRATASGQAAPAGSAPA